MSKLASHSEFSALPPFAIDKPIVLVGMMGAGKSTIGARLGKALGGNGAWVDCDQFIEKEQGFSIKDIFAQQGEAAFRKMELAAIKKLLAKKHAIISLGGGGFANDKVRALCQSDAITIWLKAKAETILKRISNSRERPLLQGKNKKEVIEALIKEREPFYQKAAITIEEKDNIEETTQQIIDRLRQWGKIQAQNE